MRKGETEVSPGAHVAHHSHPAKPLDEKILHRIVIGNGLDGVREQLDFEALLRNQPADEKIISRTIFDGFVAAESSKVGARRDDRLSQSEFDSIELARHQNSGVEVGYHADGLKMLRKCLVLSGNVQAGHSSHF